MQNRMYRAAARGNVTQSSTWGMMSTHIVNGVPARDALFGTGTQGNGLISAVVIGGDPTKGQNPYPNMRKVLGGLGIKNSNVDAHNSHFHIYLNPPKPLELTAHLLADGSASSPDSASTAATQQAEAQGLLDYAQNLITGEELMFTMDVPAVPAQETPIVLAQTSAPAAGITPQPDFILKGCQQTESTGNPRSADRAVDPAGLLTIYLGNRDHRVIDLATEATIKPILLEGTTHGKIVMFSNIANYGGTAFRYDPIPNYEGKDRAVFLAEFEGKVYKIVVNIVVSPHVGESPLLEGEEPVCPPAQLIKVKKPATGSSDSGPAYTLGSVTVTFGALAGGAIGQTTGNSITLDPTASGNGWFIDTTPGTNEERRTQVNK